MMVAIDSILRTLEGYGEVQKFDVKGKDRKTVYYCFVEKSQRASLIKEMVARYGVKHRINGSSYLKCSVGYLELSHAIYVVFKAMVVANKLAANALKPEKFGIVGKTAISQLGAKILSALQTDKGKGLGQTGQYCSLLVGYEMGSITKKQVQDFYRENKRHIDLRSVIKDFGECLGPIAIMQRKLLKGKDVTSKNITATSSVEFPARPNEPLLDYILYLGREEINVSAKADSGKTNTVKPKDILSTVEKDDVRSLENGKIKYDILKMIEDHSAWMGSVAVGTALRDAGVEELRTFEDSWVVSTKRKDEIVPDEAAWWVERVNKKLYDDWEGKVTYTGLGQVVGIFLEEYTKKNPRLDYRDIIIRSLSNKLIYCMFGIDSTGIPTWAIKTGKDLYDSTKRPYLRNKNYQVKNSTQVRASDKIGFQM